MDGGLITLHRKGHEILTAVGDAKQLNCSVMCINRVLWTGQRFWTLIERHDFVI